MISVEKNKNKKLWRVFVTRGQLQEPEKLSSRSDARYGLSRGSEGRAFDSEWLYLFDFSLSTAGWKKKLEFLFFVYCCGCKVLFDRVKVERKIFDESLNPFHNIYWMLLRLLKFLQKKKNIYHPSFLRIYTSSFNATRLKKCIYGWSVNIGLTPRFKY